jgi:hypothetical protein
MKKTIVLLAIVLLSTTITAQAARLSTLSSSMDTKSVEKLTMILVESTIRFSYFMGETNSATPEKLKRMIGLLIESGCFAGENNVDLEEMVEIALQRTRDGFRKRLNE